MEKCTIPEKSSNEILTELFGAFNAEPPKIVSRKHSFSEAEDIHNSKKIKKNKKAKKKHKSKNSKKHKKRKTSDNDDESFVDGRKKKKKKRKKNDVSPHSVNIELPIDKVPVALQINLDGTVGIKGDDGVVMHIPSDNEGDGDDIEADTEDVEADTDCAAHCETAPELQNETSAKCQVSNLVTEVFETKNCDQGEPKKGKIQIKNLMLSSVYQETVKAVEEKHKLELEKKANYEEGELSDSGDSRDDSRIEDEDRPEEDTSKLIHVKSNHGTSRRQSTDRESHGRRRIEHRSHKRRKRETEGTREASHERRHRQRGSSSRSHRSQESHDVRSRHDRHSHYSRSHSHRSRSRDHRVRSRDRSEKAHHRSVSREPVRSNSKENNKSDKIDKEKLLAIARKNALKLIDSGILPGAEKLTTKAGGKTVNELTEYCKKLSKREALGDDLSDIDSDSSEEDDKPFHHPFQVRDRPNSIVLNIKNSVQLPVKSLQEKAVEQSKQLRLQFPVSSGSSHRRTESEWVAVPKKEEPVKPKAPPPVSKAPPPPAPVAAPAFLPMPPAVMELSTVPPPEPVAKPVFPVIQPSTAASKFDISTIVSKRLEAMRRLQENPNDSQALTQLFHAQKEMQFWAETKQESGAFTGSTGAKVLTPQELSTGVQAWAKRDQLTNATPVKGGMGMTLLQKMGWQPGEGLGKNKEGTLEPLKLEVKMDKKGLLAADEAMKGRKGGNVAQAGPPLPTVKTLDGKHPVSLLNEFCTRRRYGIPQFDICLECGPDHKKSFLFKVKVNGIEYTPSLASPNKKQAKAEAAAICLRALGVIGPASE